MAVPKIQVCTGRKCRRGGSCERVLEIEELSDAVGTCAVTSTTCMGACRRGPCVRSTAAGRSKMYYGVDSLATSAEIVQNATGKTVTPDLLQVQLQSREQPSAFARICFWLFGGNVPRSRNVPETDRYIRWHLKAVTVVSNWSAIYHCGTSDGGRGKAPGHSSWHVTLFAKTPDVERDYTPVSTAEEWDKGCCSLLIKIYPGGKATSWLHTLPVGSELLLSPPKPTLVLPCPPGPKAAFCQSILLVAGGTGIAPAWQILDACRAGDMRNSAVTLLYSCRKDDVLMAEPLKQIAEANPKSRLTLTLTEPSYGPEAPFPDFASHQDILTGERLILREGRIDRPFLEHEVLALPTPPRVVVSGPETMNLAIRALLLDIGLSAEAITVLQA